MKKNTYFISCFIFIILWMPIWLSAQNEIPEAPNPPRLVNDFANILSSDQIEEMENSLIAMNDTTSVQIVVIVVPSLNGYDPADYAQRLGQKWGVGEKKYDNGFIILVKPKSDTERGEAFIATGYGVEQYVTDAIAWEIVNNRMIPYFRDNDYYGGINAAIDSLIQCVAGKYQSDGQSDSGSGVSLIVIIIIVIIIIIISSKNNRHRNISGKGGSSPVFFPWGMSGGSSRSGGFGGFGGSSGGFGGFGGGSFGGGGAGGSW